MWLSGHGPHPWRSPGRRLIQERFRFTFSPLWPAPTWFSSEGNSAFHSWDSQTPNFHIRLPLHCLFWKPLPENRSIPWLLTQGGVALCWFFPSLFVHFMYLNVIVEHFCHQCASYIGLWLHRPHIPVSFLPYRDICDIRSTVYNKHDVIGWCKH